VKTHGVTRWILTSDWVWILIALFGAEFLRYGLSWDAAGGLSPHHLPLFLLATFALWFLLSSSMQLDGFAEVGVSRPSSHNCHWSYVSSWRRCLREVISHDSTSPGWLWVILAFFFWWALYSSDTERAYSCAPGTEQVTSVA